MERTCYLGNEKITLEQLEDVVAVELDDEAEEGRAAEFGDSVDLRTEFELDEDETGAFEDAGWRFVKPTEQTRGRAERGETPAGAKSLGQVFRAEGGRLYVLGDRLTVRLDEDLSEDEAKAVLEDNELEIVQELTFAPNLYEVRVTGSDDPLDLSVELHEDPKFDYAEPNFIEHIPGRFTPSDPEYDQQWQWNNDGTGGATAGADVDAEEAWDYAQGNGTRVAVVDNSIDVSHADLAGGVTGAGYYQSTSGGGASFNTGTSGFPSGDHGTFCAGMAAARAGNGEGGVGAAFEADLVPVATLSDALGTQTTLGRAIAYAADPTRELSGADPANGADVISCSLGPNGSPFPMRSVLQNAIDFAVNNGRGGLGTPVFWAVDNTDININQDQVCSYQNTIAVGRSDNDDEVSGSANGAALDFLAPGEDVYNAEAGGTYRTWTGTSFAAPLAAGVGALVLQMDPDLRWDEVRTILRQTCDQVGGVTYGADDRHPEYGFGRVNAADAVCRALRAVELTTLSLTFNDVPQDETTVRAATFSVSSCESLNLQVTSGPTLTSGSGSFDLPLGSTVTVSPTGTGSTTARVWVSYSAAGVSPGVTANGTVTVEDVETGQEWTIPLSANVVERESVAVDLVLDESGSMSSDSGVTTVSGAPRTRLSLLQYSAPLLIELLEEDDAIGVVKFSEDAQAATSDIDTAGPSPFGSGRTQAKTAIQNLSPGGTTSIGDGVELASSRLSSLGSYDDEAIVVFTDGHENEPKYLSDVSGMIDETVFAIGLGTPEQLKPAALNSLANGTGGYVVLTDELGSDDNFLLAKYFMQILAGVKNNDIVVDPQSRLSPGETHRIPFRVTEADVHVDVAVIEPASGLFRFWLETPAGETIDAAAARTKPEVSLVDAENVTYYRFNPPVSTDSGPAGRGRWHAVLEIDEKYYQRYLAQLQETKTHVTGIETVQAQGVKYNLSVYTDSGLSMETTLSQDSYEPGATLTLRAALRQYGAVPVTDATVTADLSMPDGTVRSLELDAVEDGVYEAQIGATAAGTYRADVRARGRSLRGTPFTREQIRTAAVWHGGDDPAPTAAADPSARPELLCDLFECLSEEAFTDAMEQWGVDPDAVADCIECYCEQVDALGPAETPKQQDGESVAPGVGGTVNFGDMKVADLLEMTNVAKRGRKKR